MNLDVSISYRNSQSHVANVNKDWRMRRFYRHCVSVTAFSFQTKVRVTSHPSQIITDCCFKHVSLFFSCRLHHQILTGLFIKINCRNKMEQKYSSDHKVTAWGIFFFHPISIGLVDGLAVSLWLNSDLTFWSEWFASLTFLITQPFEW